MDSEALRKRVFYGGVEQKLRKEVCMLETISQVLCLILHLLSIVLLNNECRSGLSCWDTMHMIQHMQRGNISRQ